MNISRLSAMAIQENPSVRAEAGFDKTAGKWVGFVSITDAKDRPRILLSTQSQFDTAKDATDHMRGIIEQVKALEVS